MAYAVAAHLPAATSANPTTLPVVPLRELLPWALFALVLGVMALFFVGAEQGAVSLFAGTGVHEFVHDGRHLLGFPCH